MCGRCACQPCSVAGLRGAQLQAASAQPGRAIREFHFTFSPPYGPIPSSGYMHTHPPTPPPTHRPPPHRTTPAHTLSHHHPPRTHLAIRPLKLGAKLLVPRAVLRGREVGIVVHAPAPSGAPTRRLHPAQQVGQRLGGHTDEPIILLDGPLLRAPAWSGSRPVQTWVGGWVGGHALTYISCARAYTHARTQQQQRHQSKDPPGYDDLRRPHLPDLLPPQAAGGEQLLRELRDAKLVVFDGGHLARVGVEQKVAHLRDRLGALTFRPCTSEMN